MSIHSVRVRALLATCFALVTSVASAQPSANGQGGPACIPNCRAGYVCASGQCISACNPPCGAGEMCTERAECVANPAAAPAPAPAPVAPPAATAAPVATQAAPGAMQAAPAPGAPAPGWNAPPQPLASAAQPGVHTHDGFYFRLGLGVGALDGSFTLHHHNTLDDSDKDEISGSGVAYLGELALGGSPKPGIVIGGGAYSSNLSGATFTLNGTKYEDQTVSFSVVGPFMDLYPNPGQGFHVQFALGLGVASAAKSNVIQDDYAGVGFGAMGGIGYEGWIGDQWSLGGVARLTYANVTLKEASGNNEVDASMLVPGLLLVVTCH